ncbi:MAG TPA: UDP-N-acetylmuramoyl-L-alanine--D-glutamate ligase [Thermomicrobiales bacterium]|nr:UDP-N-acetylmuramoyl-L-alanine--D-glutamate ligase [Thermomicrobiales bacterium]
MSDRDRAAMGRERTVQRGEPFSLAGKRVLVMGLGTHRGGLGVARFLATQGAAVTVTDLRTDEQLAGPLGELAGLPIRYVLGEHREADFTGADLVVRNPGVPRESPYLAAARAAGVPVEMEMTLFFRLCPAPILGVTGTKGKTTTTTLGAAMLAAWRPDTVLAGNMGVSALEQLAQIGPATPVTIELSSFQLEALAERGLSPHVAVVTNLSPDHLNRYATMADYAAAKRGIVAAQDHCDFAVLNRDDPAIWAFAVDTAARVLPFGRADAALGGGDGAWLAGDELRWRFGGVEHRAARAALPAPGEHNALNALAAGLAALAYGAPFAAVAQGLAAFGGVRDRFEAVAEMRGVAYVNDTTATAPAAAIAALRAADRPVVLIAGGSEKRTDFADFAREVAARARQVVLLDGDATPRLRAALVAAGVGPERLHGPAGGMEEAVRLAAALAQPGELVLLSPACASFGMFPDEFHRGDAFRAAVAALAGKEAP